MNRTGKAGVLVLAAALSVSLAGCATLTQTVPATSLPTPSPTQRALPQITLTTSDLAACSSEPTRSRIDAAVAQSTISPKNSPLALPQDMGSYEKAATQLKLWDALSATDRQYQLCFNYEQGSFGTNTPTP